MDNLPPQKPLPKKSCIITLMFAIESDKDALDIKQQFNEVVKDIKDKRFTFQIIES